MKSLILLPYCPLPADHGGKVEMWKTLECLREMGPCTVLSARSRPVGMGWTQEALAEMQRRGFEVVLREDDELRRFRPRRALGLAYGALAKGLRLERAFGHANPYHRWAFNPDWVRRQSEGKDLAVLAYSFWAGFPTECPKVCLLLDLWSDYMWGGSAKETKDLQTVDLTIVISKQEEERLRNRGVTKTLWSPPFVDAIELPDSDRVGLVGSANPFNREGLRWLGSGLPEAPIQVYGSLASYATSPGFEAVGKYADIMDPYRDCGIILMVAAGGTGVQIKSIEALAAGRAIVARRGAMRGIPPGNGAWIEVDNLDEMILETRRLHDDVGARIAQMADAQAYYREHLDACRLRAKLKAAFTSLIQCGETA